ncbi:hypothetical protein ACQPXH_07125 [Nocardia sp. CA-135953]|uniref:hypothetical protein n=1 Tax=Nocardia sp. CA-135953 TaxID=3239978 RepID=UPI003D98AB8F
MNVDWQVYYDAAKRCHDLAADLRRADKPVHDAVKGDCVGMAGDAPGCKQWGEKYDEIAQQTMQTCTNLADALTNFGYILYANGYNYGIKNKSNPAPPQPEIHAMTEYKVTIPSSVRDNGNGVKHDGGVEDFFEKLIKQIIEEFGKLPNGDVDKLAKASTTWKIFANHETVTGAATRITAISDLFHGMDDDTNRDLIQGYFSTLRIGAESVVSASQNIAAPVADYHTGTVDVGKGIASAITTFEWAVGLLVTGAVLGALFSFGGSIVAGAGGVSVAVADTLNAIRTVYSTSKLIKVVGITAAVAGAVGTISAFNQVPSLFAISTSLVEIIALRAHIDSDGAGGNPNESGTGSSELPNVRDPKKFDPQSLAGKSQEEIAQGIPPGWVAKPSKSGDGTVYVDPDNFGRQIRVMPGYTDGNRPDPLTHGPYAEVSQNGKTTKVPLQGNPTLGGK